MENQPEHKIYHWLVKYHKIISVVITIVMLVAFYFYIKALNNNHLSHTHVMYLVIVFAGSVLGYGFGIATGIIAGILVGPLMPYDLITGEMQLFSDWAFRLIMMVIVGAMSGYFSKNYRYVQNRIKSITNVNVESNLFNINYLNEYNFNDDEPYLIMSMVIANYKTISDVVGYKAYYEYIQKINETLKVHFPDSVLIQVATNKLWFITKLHNFNQHIDDIVKDIKKINHISDTKLFVDFGLGFHQIRIDKKNIITNYFIDTDLAANQALEKHILYTKFANIETTKKFEYELLSEFDSALIDGQIYLEYQPKIDLKTRKPIGLEALIRWYHPTKKMIYPDQFIPAVEETSLIHKMTEEVFRKSLVYHQKLKEKGIEIPISINISTKNLYDVSFYNQMIHIFSTFDVKPSMVELEITETVLMEKPELSKQILEKFANFGFKIAIDDFGKGYSSLAYLAQFPINTIKIDRFFTSTILISPTAQAIVKATINLALQLGYEVLIEGVEDLKTANLMESYGCHTAQGYYFMKPQKEITITEYLSAQYR